MKVTKTSFTRTLTVFSTYTENANNDCGKIPTQSHTFIIMQQHTKYMIQPYSY